MRTREGRRYPLHIQLALPAGYRTSTEADAMFSTLAELHLTGVELNIANPWSIDLDDLSAYLSGYGLKLLNFASGLTAKTLGLSLSSADDAARERAVERCADLIRLFSGKTDGIILGFFKGPAGQDPGTAVRQFRRSLEELAPIAVEAHVRLVVEATNRYESAVANTLGQTAELIGNLPAGAAGILPDTFHMNIEEADMFSALEQCRDLYASVHLSDNNRFFPGFGAIDFAPIIDHLEQIGFTGDLAIEGNLKNGFVDDVRRASAYLEPMLASRR